MLFYWSVLAKGGDPCGTSAVVLFHLLCGCADFPSWWGCGRPSFFSWGVWLMLRLLLGAIVLGVECLVMGVFCVMCCICELIGQCVNIMCVLCAVSVN